MVSVGRSRMVNGRRGVVSSEVDGVSESEDMIVKLFD
jgi:hypothetical protein